MRVVAALMMLTALCLAATALAATAPQPGDLRDCRTRGEGNQPQKLPPIPGVRLGPVVIWPSVRTRVDPTESVPWAFYVKAPVVVEARVRAVLAVAPEAGSLAAMQSRRGGFVSAVRFQACRERVPAWTYQGTVGRYTGFRSGSDSPRSPSASLWNSGSTGR